MLLNCCENKNKIAMKNYFLLTVCILIFSPRIYPKLMLYNIVSIRTICLDF